jgi:hypothetical protein
MNEKTATPLPSSEDVRLASHKIRHFIVKNPVMQKL